MIEKYELDILNVIMNKKIQTKIKILYTYYMSFIGIVGQLVFYAQGIKIFQTKSAKDVSILAFTFGLISVTSWFIYGFVIRDKPLIIANFVAIIGAVFVLSGIYFYG